MARREASDEPFSTDSGFISFYIRGRQVLSVYKHGARHFFHAAHEAVQDLHRFLFTIFGHHQLDEAWIGIFKRRSVFCREYAGYFPFPISADSRGVEGVIHFVVLFSDGLRELANRCIHCLEFRWNYIVSRNLEEIEFTVGRYVDIHGVTGRYHI